MRSRTHRDFPTLAKALAATSNGGGEYGSRPIKDLRHDRHLYSGNYALSTRLTEQFCMDHLRLLLFSAGSPTVDSLLSYGKTVSFIPMLTPPLSFPFMTHFHATAQGRLQEVPYCYALSYTSWAVAPSPLSFTSYCHCVIVASKPAHIP